MTILELIVHSLQILIPAYFANGAPTLLINLKKHPIDFNKKWFDKRRIFGEGKTIEGFMIAISFCFIIGLLENLIISKMSFNFLKIPNYAFLFIGLGVMIGDSIGSFIKRRLNLKRGEKAGLIDMIDFVFGAFVSARFFTDFSIFSLIIGLAITPPIHRAASIIGYKIKLKKEPW